MTGPPTATAPAYTLFGTPLGECVIAWNDTGVVAIRLPEGHADVTRRRLLDTFTEAEAARPPRTVQRAIEGMRSLMAGTRPDLSSITLDMDGVPPFHRRVYEAARDIPVGSTLSYGDLAVEAGSPGAARAVGQALGRNPFAIVVPCHRVTAAGGKVGGFSATGGVGTKLRLLELEGTPLPSGNGGGGANGHAASRRWDVTAAVEHLRASDSVMRRLVDRIGPCTFAPRPTSNVFAVLLEAIVFQQLSGKAAATIHERVLTLVPLSRSGPRPDGLLQVSDDALRAAGLSQAKVRALRDLAQRTVDRSLPSRRELERMDDAAVIDALTEVRGIGRWTAEMFLVFRLGRPDVLALDDLGIRTGYQRAFRLPEPPIAAVVARRAERWRPYRTVAGWYLWRVAEQERGQLRVKNSWNSI
jgi:methylated-DNA-[protein]-cysteine S-methyltransferase